MIRPPKSENEVPIWRRWVQMVLTGKAPFGIGGYTDVYPSGVSIGGGSATPSFSAYGGSNLQAREFIGAATAKDMTFEFQFPHERADESDIVPHIHLYIPDDATGGTIRFTCEYEWTEVWDTGAVVTTTLVGTVVRTANAGISKNHILSFGEVSGVGKGLSSIFSCRIRRDPTDAGDTFGASVWLKSADIHVYVLWPVGSRSTFLR